LQVDVPATTPYLWVKVPEGYSDEDFVLNKMIGEAHVPLCQLIFWSKRPGLLPGNSLLTQKSDY
jgi:aspartate/methionine/tyrosine aminotransferase